MVSVFFRVLLLATSILGGVYLGDPEAGGVTPPTSCVTGPCATFPGSDKLWTKIWGCSADNNGKYLFNNFRDAIRLAGTATQIIITQGDRYVISKPDTYPIRMLSHDLTFSYNQNPPWDLWVNLTVIQATWDGPDDLLATMTSACKFPVGAENLLYHACWNSQGLHLGHNICRWHFRSGYEGPINVYIDAGYRPLPIKPQGCDTCRRYNNKWWTRVYQCSGTIDDGVTMPLLNVMLTAAQAKQVLITNGLAGTYVVSSAQYAQAYPIAQLRLGLTVSYRLVPPANSTIADPTVIAAMWNGPQDLLDRLPQNCNLPGAFDLRAYHACDTNFGLHVATMTNMCTWSYRRLTYEDWIEFFVDTPCTCPLAPCNTQPPAPTGLSASCSSTPSGSSCSRTCDKGYTGVVSYTCNNGAWVQPQGTCKPTSCTTQPPAVTGITTICATTPSGSSCTRACSNGYGGSVSFPCSLGTWGPANGACSANSCSNQPSVPGISTSCGTVASGGSCQQQCGGGYSGSVTYQCQAGSWGVVGGCTPNSCSNQPTVPGISTSCGTVNSGGSCQQSCGNGYTGTVTFTCSTGTWGAIGGCTPNSCTSPPSAIEGITTTCPTTTSGSTCTLNCDQGYYGSVSWVCTAGSWGAPSDACIAEPPPPPGESYLEFPKKNNRFGASLQPLQN